MWHVSDALRNRVPDVKYGRLKVVLIFLQLGVGRLLGMYMAYFQPFRQYVTVKVDGSD
jgi:hypothetical protein